MRSSFLLATLVAGLAAPSQADDAIPGDPFAGRALAAEHCARCHATAPGETSPERNAPSFASFGQDWPVSALQEALAEGIMVSHSDPPMPEFSFSPQEIDDLIAYLESVAGSQPTAD